MAAAHAKAAPESIQSTWWGATVYGFCSALGFALALILFASLRENLAGNGLDESSIPIVLQYNKRDLADAFARHSRRRSTARWEHPSAAAIIIRATTDHLDWVSLGDCALIVETPAGLKSIGVGGPDTGDSRLASALQRLRQKQTLSTEAERRSELLPQLRKGRGENLNLPGGYGVISITPPPRELITTGRLPVESSSHVLLATDGLMRLVEIFERYDAQTLLETAKAKGLASLLDELRGLEADDSACLGHPRLKQSDDATGLLMRIR